MTIPEIQNEAANLWGITTEHIKHKGRVVEDVAPRRSAMVASVIIFEYAMSTVDRAFNAAIGSTRHFIKSKKDFALMDRLKHEKLLVVCQQRKNKLLQSMSCIRD